MREEIAAAVVFVKRLVQMNDNNLSNTKIDEFSSCLSTILVNRFRNHWYAEKPYKGQGYRCIRINPCDPKDDVLEQAAKKCGLKFWDLNMPSEMTLWVDPCEVYCRFGETTGACCKVASFKNGQTDNKAHTIDLEDLVERSKQQSLHIMGSRNHYSNTNNNFNQLHNKVHQYQNQSFTLVNDQVHWQQQQQHSSHSYSSYNKNINRRNNKKGSSSSKSSDSDSDSGSHDRFHWACKKSNITVSKA